MNNGREAASQERVINYQIYKSIDYSGFFERLFARWIDLSLDAGIGYLIYRKWGIPAALAGVIIFDLIHRIVMTYFFGGTLGKLLFGVRVVSRCSNKLSIWQVLIREFSKLISHLPLNLGFLCVIFSRRKRALHDIIACTAVTSGGKDEAEYAKKVYSERPEKWNPIISGIITAAFAVSIFLAVTFGASYILNNMGMIGFTLDNNSDIDQYSYKLPDAGSGAAGLNKNIIQIGDINGSGNYQIFREYIDDGKCALTSMRSAGPGFKDGNALGTFDKPVIQYRLADMDGDQKDELAVLFEDKSIKFYKLDNGMSEIGALGPLEYKQINAFVKGKPDEDTPYRLYIAGDGKKVSVISFKEGKFTEQKFELPGQYNIIGIDCGVFSGEYCLTALCDGGNIVFYSFDGSKYLERRKTPVPVKGKLSMTIKDINMDRENEILISSQGEGGKNLPLLAAYNVSGNNLKLVWSGGNFYKYKDTVMALTMDDGMVLDGKFRAYMVYRHEAKETGAITFFTFENYRILMKANQILRALAIF